jgi:predicted AlkP superfamily pyrophosphatase or phosphodiesterase
MNLPNYKDGSIPNLMTSIGKSLNSRYKSIYSPLKTLSPNELRKSKKIVLLIIDGLGYEFLQKQKSSFLYKNIRGKMTSVFPSSTSAAIPTFLTGTPSNEHSMTGWFTFIKEIGMQVIPLPFVPRSTHFPPLGEFIDIKEVFNIKPFTNKIKTRSYLVQYDGIIDSHFTLAAAGKSKLISHKGMNQFFSKIKSTISTSNKKKYIYAYYNQHDSLSHDHGTNNSKVLKHFKKLDKKIASFVKYLKDTTLIITADHGQINTPKSKIINLNDHPKLQETLSIPMCGEHRFAYFYIKQGKQKQFEKYVKSKLNKYCHLFKSKDLVKRNLFGLGSPNKKFLNRIGDYTMIMKHNHAIYEKLDSQKHYNYQTGDHGGVSKEEMYVPIILIKK